MKNNSKKKRLQNLIDIVYSVAVVLVALLLILIIIVRITSYDSIIHMIDQTTEDTTEFIRDTTELTTEESVIETELETETEFETTETEELIVEIEVVEYEPVYYREDIPLDANLQSTLYLVCVETNIDLNLMLGLIQLESNFNTEAINNYEGCYGLMQLNPRYFPSDLTPAENIDYGVRHFAKCLYSCNDNIAMALTMYHAGHDNGDRSYANTVLNCARNWGYAY